MKTYINPMHLWKYREFDRSETPAPSCFGMVQHTVEQVALYLKTHETEPIEFVIINNAKGLVVDGCHRLLGSIMNGFSLIQVNIKHVTQVEADRDYYPATLNRFVPLL